MPNAESPLLQAERRSWKYWSADGIPLILSGLICIAVSALVMLLWGLPHSQRWMLIPIALCFLSALKLRAMAEWLKARYIWPRTGYVSAPVYADLMTGMPPEVLSIRPADQAAMELQRLRRGKILSVNLFAAFVAALLPQMAAQAGAKGRPVVWLALGAGIATVAIGLLRFLRVLRRHPLERA